MLVIAFENKILPLLPHSLQTVALRGVPAPPLVEVIGRVSPPRVVHRLLSVLGVCTVLCVLCTVQYRSVQCSIMQHIAVNVVGCSGVKPVESVPCAMVGHYENIFLKPKNLIFFCFSSIYLRYNSLKK